MKKASAVLLVLFMVLLIGCGKKAEISPIVNGISFTAEIKYNGKNYSVDTVTSKEGEMSAVVKKPESLAGMKISFDGETVKTEYLGLCYEQNINDVKQNNAALVLFDVLSAVNNGENAVKSDSGNYTLKKKKNGIEYELTVSPTGLPVSLVFPDNDITVEFLNTTVLE